MNEQNDFANFLSDEDIFKLEMEKYIPEFFEHQKAGTLDTDEAFKSKTAELVKLSKKAGIDLKKFLAEKLS